VIRRFNYTGRKRIRREHVDIVVRELGEGAATFDATVELERYALPPEALVFVEAYRSPLWMRFGFGTVELRQTPDERRLTEFESTEGLLFRVKVTSPNEHRRLLLAEADQIPLRRPEQKPDRRVPLLPVVPEDLGDEVARLDFGPSFEDRPKLFVNRNLGDWPTIAKSPAFAAMVYPQALREILTRVLWIEEYYELEPADDWRAQWLRFATLAPGVGAVPQKGEQEYFDDWIRSAVETFARHQRLGTVFEEFWSKEGRR
jgi:hypothetical protein